jgi:hypothetical protein
MSVQIRGGQIQDSSISATQLKNSAVEEDKLKDASVSTSKIAANAVTSAKLATGVINATALIGNEVVTAAKIDLSGSFDFSNGTLQAGTPSNSADVANKEYVDGIVGGGVYWKEPARVASTANVNISNPGTASFDGVTLASGDRILLKDQTSASENGVYDFNGSSSALTRSSDANTADELNGLAIFIKEGSASADQGFVQTSEIGTLGSDNVVFVQFTGLGQITAGDGLTKTGNTLSVELGDGMTTSGGALEVSAGDGLDFSAGDLAVQVDDSSIQISGNALRVKADGITSSMIGSGQVTGTEISTGGVLTANLADSSVSAAKLGASAVTEAKLASLSISESKIQNNAITASKISSTVAGDGLSGAGGSALAVNVDSSTIEISSDTLQVKNLGITNAKLANGSVDSGKLADASVGASKLSTNVAGSGLSGGNGTALAVNCGDGLDFNGDDVEVQLGDGLEFSSGDVQIKFDGVTIGVTTDTGELQVKDESITNVKMGPAAIGSTELANNAVIASKVGFVAYQEATVVSGSSTTTIDLARTVDSAFSNGILVFKNGLCLINSTALGGTASNNDQFNVSIANSVTRLTFGAALTSGDNILVVYTT